jgi:hypothetical protein
MKYDESIIMLCRPRWFRFGTFLRRVPPGLKARAAMEGMSMSDYIRREVGWRV